MSTLIQDIMTNDAQRVTFKITNTDPHTLLSQLTEGIKQSDEELAQLVVLEDQLHWCGLMYIAFHQNDQVCSEILRRISNNAH